MALHYKLTNIKDWETVCYTDEEDPDTRTLKPDVSSIIILTMPCGIGDLTEKTLPEFVLRCKILEGITNSYHHPASLPLSSYKAMLGLHTNVAYESRTKWLKRIYDGNLMSIAWDLKSDLDK